MYTLVLTTILAISGPFMGNMDIAMTTIEVKDINTCNVIGTQYVKDVKKEESAFLVKVAVIPSYKCYKTK